MDLSLDVLKQLATELNNEQLTSAVATIETDYKNNYDRINYLEKDLNKSIEKRDSFKNELSLVKTKFGFDEITEDAIEGFLSSKGNGDEALKKEISSLTSMVDALKSEKEGLQGKYSDTLNNIKIEKELLALGAVEETEGQKAYDILLGEIKNGMSIVEDGSIVFKAEDGTTIRNSDGSPMTLSNRYEQLKSNEALNFLFKTKRSKAGSGSQRSGSYVKEAEYFDKNSANFNLTKQAEIYKTNPALYKQLKG